MNSNVSRNKALCLPETYISNLNNEYFADTDHAPGFVWQPEVYKIAQHLLNRGEYEAVIDLGCGSGQRLADLDFTGKKVGVDYGDNIKHASAQYPGATWMELDLNREINQAAFPKNALVICSDVIEHLSNPLSLIRSIKNLLESKVARSAIISTPDRDRARGEGDFGPPANRAHVSEWTLEELGQLLQRESLPVVSHGFTRNFSLSLERGTQIAIADLEMHNALSEGKSQNLTALAIMPVFNESDIVESKIQKLLNQGFSVHVLDNWSNDGSFELLSNLSKTRPKMSVERFPNRESEKGDWMAMLKKIEEIGFNSNFDWIFHIDADEEIMSFRENVSVLQAIFAADKLGFNSIDFTLMNFRPTKKNWLSRPNFTEYFEFETDAWAGSIARAWKNDDVYPEFHSSGGHKISTHTRIFPFNLALLHFPLRNRKQALRKIFAERLPRFSEERESLGWHTHYSAFKESDKFVWKKDRLIRLQKDFQREYLLEIIGRCGLKEQSNFEV